MFVALQPMTSPSAVRILSCANLVLNIATQIHIYLENNEGKCTCLKRLWYPFGFLLTCFASETRILQIISTDLFIYTIVLM